MKKFVILFVVFILLLAVLGLSFFFSIQEPDSSSSSSSIQSALSSSQEEISSTPSQQNSQGPSQPSQGESAAPSSSQSAFSSSSGSAQNGVDYMRLVNTDNPLPADYSISTQEAANGLKMETTAAQALQRMFAAAQKDGIRLMCVSGYRTVQRQTELFNAKVQEYLNLGYSEQDAKTEAAKLVQIPGSSEHNSGLAADIVYEGYWNDYDDLYEDFENSQAFAWLDEHAHEYGFILRYPKNKEQITGISYEPWHYRYVGSAQQALDIKNSGLCLEEYVANR